MRVIQAGRVELDELHVRHPAAGAPGHRHAVAGSGVGVGGVEVNLAGAARRQHRLAGAQGQHAIADDVQHVGAQASIARQPEFCGGDQVDRDVAFEHGDVGMVAYLLGQGLLYRSSRRVGRMDDAALPVAAFARQVETQRGIIRCEWHAAPDQPLYRLAPVLDDETGRHRIAQARAGRRGIADMGIYGVGRVEDRGDAALCPGRRRIGQHFLGDQCHSQAVGQAQGQRLAGQAAADDEDVEMLDGGGIHGAGLYHWGRDRVSAWN